MPARYEFSNKDSVSLKYGVIYWAAGHITVFRKIVHIFKNICHVGRHCCLSQKLSPAKEYLDSSWHVMPHGDARGEGAGTEGETGEWSGYTVPFTLPRNMVYPALLPLMPHTSAASSRLNWCPRQFKCTRPFRRKTKSGFCACAITFQLPSTSVEMYREG